MTDTIDQLPVAEEHADGRPSESVHSGNLYAKYRRLAAEQAALRRLATLVAQRVEPMELLGAVAEEMRRCLHAPCQHSITHALSVSLMMEIMNDC